MNVLMPILGTVTSFCGHSLTGQCGFIVQCLLVRCRVSSLSKAAECIVSCTVGLTCPKANGKKSLESPRSAELYTILYVTVSCQYELTLVTPVSAFIDFI